MSSCSLIRKRERFVQRRVYIFFHGSCVLRPRGEGISLHIFLTPWVYSTQETRIRTYLSLIMLPFVRIWTYDAYTVDFLVCLKRGSRWRGGKKWKCAYSDRHMYETNANAMGLASFSSWMFGAKFLLKENGYPLSWNANTFRWTGWFDWVFMAWKLEVFVPVSSK